MTSRILEKSRNDFNNSRKLESIDTAQLEYTAERLFTYGTIVIGVIAVYAAVIYMGVQQLKK